MHRGREEREDKKKSADDANNGIKAGNISLLSSSSHHQLHPTAAQMGPCFHGYEQCFSRSARWGSVINGGVGRKLIIYPGEGASVRGNVT